MKLTKRISALAMATLIGAMTMIPTIPTFAWSKVDGVHRMPDGVTPIENVLARGVDVSHWKKTIDWNQVAANDIQFAMLGTTYKGGEDPFFRINAENATKAGIQIGAYLYSYATTVEMALKEADFILDLVKDYPISYPIAFDIEDKVQSNLSKSEVSDLINAFCGKIEAAGYYPMVYANDHWLANKIDMSKVKYDVWVARYEKKHAYVNPAMWQATSTGSIPGVNGNVDINFQYKDFTPHISPNLFRTIGDKTYYYQNHIMQKDTWINDGKSWFYMNPEGLKTTGWFEQSGKKYYLHEASGEMATGWKEMEEGFRYFSESGEMAYSWVVDNNSWYHLGNDGIMKTGWIKDGEKHYYLKSSGAMATGWRQIDQQWYLFNPSGDMATGWAKDGEKYYYLKDNGTMATGWRQIDQQWYFLNPSGDMATGWLKLDNVWYFLNGDGSMKTGWHTEGNQTYFLSNSSGKMTTGWREVDGSWYYFNENGAMTTGIITLNNTNYYLSPENGKMLTNTTIELNGTNYAIDNNGVASIVETPVVTPEATEVGPGVS